MNKIKEIIISVLIAIILLGLAGVLLAGKAGLFDWKNSKLTESTSSEQGTQQEIISEENEDKTNEDRTNEDKTNEDKTNEDKRSGDKSSADKKTGNTDGGLLEVHFIDVGQGDATLIICDGHAMLIDAGDYTQGSRLQLYLKKQGVESLDYVICTHPDADHIGGMDVIITKFDCGSIFMPDVTNETISFSELKEALSYRNYRTSCPAVGSVFSLGSASFTIIAPNKDYGEELNNWSIGILLRNGENSFLFTGDAEEEAEEDMLQNGIDLSADVLKTGHHGSSYSTCQDFLDAVKPAYAVISAGEGNDYGHPTEELLSRLKSAGIEVFRTDEQGTVIAISDGKNITWNCSPSQTWQPGVAAEDSSSEDSSKEIFTENYSSEADREETFREPEAGTTYVLNLLSMKFHLPTCDAVREMSENNREDVDWTREECTEAGYQPCGWCEP